MPLQVTPVNRNLQTRVTFMLLEMEDLFIVLGAAAIMNLLGHFVGGEIAGIPTNIVLQYGVPLLMVPVLMAFKYGKPRGYVRDLAFWYMKPHAYRIEDERPIPVNGFCSFIAVSEISDSDGISDFVARALNGVAR